MIIKSIMIIFPGCVLPENAYDMEITYDAERVEGSFRVNTQNYRVLIVPKLQFITPHMKAALKQLQAAHFPVYLWMACRKV